MRVTFVQRLHGIWNWKSAVFSALIRSPIYTVAALQNGPAAATKAGVTDALFRLVLAGVLGALTQRLAALPRGWRPMLGALVGVPVIAHTIEAFVHWSVPSARWTTTFRISVLFSAVSALFNLYAMRRGALVAGESGRPFHEDLKRFPGLVIGFLKYPFSRR